VQTVVLPPEILDLIFSFLDNEPSTWSILEACSETTRNPLLRGVVDRRLYAYIVVTNYKSHKLPGQFYHSDLFQYLTSNPQVANYIRTLQIQIQIPGPKRWYDQVNIYFAKASIVIERDLSIESTKGQGV